MHYLVRHVLMISKLYFFWKRIWVTISMVLKFLISWSFRFFITHIMILFLEAHVSMLSLFSSRSSTYLALCCRLICALFFLFFSSFFFFFFERNKSRFLSYSSTVLKIKGIHELKRISNVICSIKYLYHYIKYFIAS